MARGQRGGWLCLRQKGQGGGGAEDWGAEQSEKRPRQQLLWLQKFETGLFTNTNVGEE